MTISIVEAGILLAAFAIGLAIGRWWSQMRAEGQLRALDERNSGHERRVLELTEELLQTRTLGREQMQARDAEAAQLQTQLRELDARLAAANTQLQEERKQTEEKLALLNDAKDKLSDAFKVLSADAFRVNNEVFLSLAKETLARFQADGVNDLEQRQQAVQALVSPIQQSLDKVREHISEVEKTRAEAYGSLTQYLGQMVQSQDKLRSETGNLVKALRAPQGRGRWGEIQLKRVVEMAGMIERCDFTQQASAMTEDGRLRPDLVVRLPGGKNIVVDAKAPLSAYLEALEAPTEEIRMEKLAAHAAQVRSHLSKLSAKHYWQQFQPAPEFVVMFLPGESFFSAALEQDPALIEEGVAQQVILATPTTLITLLKAVSFGWRQEAVEENSRKISALGGELYERVRSFATHMVKVGNSLGSAVNSYNDAIGSLETRVLVSARRFKELGATDAAGIGEAEPLAKSTRELNSTVLNRAAAIAATPTMEAPAAPTLASEDPLAAADITTEVLSSEHMPSMDEIIASIEKG